MFEWTGWVYFKRDTKIREFLIKIVVLQLELDGVAHVVHGDLNVKGLPANEDSDGDDNSAPEVACINNYAVSPRELTRLLRKLQVVA